MSLVDDKQYNLVVLIEFDIVKTYLHVVAIVELPIVDVLVLVPYLVVVKLEFVDVLTMLLDRMYQMVVQ